MWTLSSDLLAALGGDEPKAVEPAVVRWSTRWSASTGPRTAATSQLVFLQPDRYWADFCRLIDREDLADDPRFVDIDGPPGERCGAASAELDDEFAKRTFEEWKAVARSDLDAPWAPVQSVTELLEDPQVAANGYIGDVVIDGEDAYRLPAVPVQFDGQPPAAAAGPGARRGHRDHAAGAGLRAGTRSSAL